MAWGLFMESNTTQEKQPLEQYISQVKSYQKECPSNEDLFNSKGGHLHVAKTMATFLINNPDQGIIGLEGSLGGGKSSIIEMLKKEFENNANTSQEENSKYHFITFDIDRYHTAIKPSLIQNIGTEIKEILKEETTKDVIQKEMDLALGKTFEYKRETNSTLPPSTISFALSIILATAVLPSFISELSKLFNSNFSCFSMFLSIILGFLCILPLVVYFEYKRKETLPDKQNFFANMFKRNGVDTISELVTINKEVGPIELEKTFQTFVENIPDSHVLVLVLDNIDRLSFEDVKTIWSELEIFTSLQGEKFRILIPYCEEHIINALAMGKEADDLHIAKEYITKRLPIVFTTPPLITVNWQEQFKNYFIATFSEIEQDNNEIKGIMKLLAVWHGDKLTPRYLKNIINKIASHLEICVSNERISKITLTAYILTQDCASISSENKISWKSLLLDKKNETQEQGEKIEETKRILESYVGTRNVWEEQLMCLHYQTSIEIAKSELIITPLKQAIENSQVSKIEELEKIHAFKEVSASVLDEFSPEVLTIFLGKVLKQKEKETEKSDWVNAWGSSINQLAHKAQKIHNNLEKEYIASLTYLQNEHNLELEDTLAIKTKDDLNIKIQKLNKTLPKPDNERYDEKLKELFSELEKIYAYNRINAQPLNFIDKPLDKFFIEILWPKKEDFTEWNISEKLKTLKTKTFVQSAYNYYEEKPDLLISLFHDLRSFCTTNDKNNLVIDFKFNVPTSSTSQCVSLLPFTQAWKNKESVEHLSHKLTALDAEDTETVSAYIAMTLVSYVKHLNSINDNIRHQANQPHQSKSAISIIQPYLDKFPNYKHYVVNYLVFVDFVKLLQFANQSKELFDFQPYIHKLYNQARISALNIKPLICSEYAVFKSFLQSNENPINTLLAFLDRWRKDFPPYNEWSKELLEDLKEYKNDTFLGKILDYFDGDKDFWNKQLADQTVHFTQGIAILHNHYKNLRSEQNLIECLKEFIRDIRTEINIPSSLFDIISEPASITSVCENKFNADTTDNEVRKWLVKNFPLELSKSPSSKILNQYASFISSITSSDKKLIKFVQSLNTDTWDITQLEKNNLEALSSALNSDFFADLEPLKSKVAKEMQKYIKNEEVPNNELDGELDDDADDGLKP